MSPSGAVQEDVDRLMGAGVLLRKRRVKDSLGVFKHALIRDAAYESLSAEARRKVHARAASVLEERFPGVVDARPEMLARHHAAADQKRQAVGYGQKAAAAALSRSAFAEATGHAAMTQEWAAVLPPPERLDTQLRANGFTLQALMSTQGWASPAVRELAERSRALLTADMAPEQTDLGVLRPVHALPRGE